MTTYEYNTQQFVGDDLVTVGHQFTGASDMSFIVRVTTLDGQLAFRLYKNSTAAKQGLKRILKKYDEQNIGAYGTFFRLTAVAKEA